jgi:uncharacterized protein (DUF952 family)
LKCAERADTVDPHGPKNDTSAGAFAADSGGRPDARLARRSKAGASVGMIYKICPASAWREAERQGVFRGSPDDLRDGFIHFSAASQVAETARKHFSGQAGLFLIAVDADALGDRLRWERSRNDELFPHLYGELDLGAVTSVLSMRTRSDGFHDIPELEP